MTTNASRKITASIYRIKTFFEIKEGVSSEVLLFIYQYSAAPLKYEYPPTKLYGAALWKKAILIFSRVVT
jgi:hypothetical protein